MPITDSAKVFIEKSERASRAEPIVPGLELTDMLVAQGSARADFFHTGRTSPQRGGGRAAASRGSRPTIAAPGRAYHEGDP